MAMTSNKKPERKSRKNYENACSKGYCPSLAERENSSIKELANRLNATSDKKEVLTNVLEWQDRNIVFWFERYPLSLAIVSAILSLLVTSPFLLLNVPVVFWCFIVLASVTVTLSSIAIYMIHSYRKLPLRQLFNIFPRSISIDSILENRLCACRDYAKLTACLLFNIYPEMEIYFVHAPSHVATGMMVDKKLYILDKWLPVVTFDRWHEKWHKHRFSKKTVERVKGTSLVSVPPPLSERNLSKLDTDRLARLENELKRRLSIQSSTIDAEGVSLKIMHWKKGAILYEDDEIVNYSLARRLKILISREMLDVNQVINIKIDQKKDDLIFRVDLKSRALSDSSFEKS
jgi:predicted transglutaminase-like protease